MQTHDQRVIHSSEESNWRTPPACFRKLDNEFAFAFDLAADAGSACVPAFLGPDSLYYENALTTPWSHLIDYAQRTAPGPGFLNPPFSKTKMNAYNTGRIKVAGMWMEHPRDPELAKVYDIGAWAKKCWEESQAGATIVGIFPFAPQTVWYQSYVSGIDGGNVGSSQQWLGHAAMEERRLPHRISFLRPDGSEAGNAGVNSAIIVWRPNPGYIGPWQPAVRYWSYR